ncbi:MAG: hypothetical protein LBU15_00980 [Rickettsiales bacterium]|jgi:chromosomal replication initiation ATPase DnaA|nr:hypothetical protein [Rickettsiales bacterium]
MTQQLTFDFLLEESHSVNNFIVFGSNLEAFCLLNRTREDRDSLDSQIIFLSGEEKCGKTHLGQIWKNNYNAKTLDLAGSAELGFDEFVHSIGSSVEKFEYYLVDNFSRNIGDDRFFCLLNTVMANNSSILIIARENPGRRPVTMKDLESRIRGGTSLKIGKLTSDAKPMLINKLFADRQIFVSGDVLRYLNGKLSPSYREVYDCVSKIARAVGESGQRLTSSFVKTII